jgi:hypothetical protein
MIGAAVFGVLALLLAAPAAQPRAATDARITSAYTTLDLDRCARLDKGEEPQSATWRCKGFAGIPLIVQNGDERFDIDAGTEDRDELWSQAFDYPGRTIEWRLRRGVPFAIIYRLAASGDGVPASSRLIVETVGGAAPGCRIASNTGPRANVRARAAADAVLRGKVRCLSGATR